MSKYVVWYPHAHEEQGRWTEFHIASRLRLTIIPDAEILAGQQAPVLSNTDFRKKIALLRYESIPTSRTRPNYTFMHLDLDLHDYDLVIVYTTEALREDLAFLQQEVQTVLNTSRVLYFVGGYQDPALLDSGNCYLQHSFFSIVSTANQIPAQIVTETKPFLFDALLGTTKSSRLWVYYQLKRFGLDSKTLINLQPNPDDIDYVSQQNIKNLIPNLVQQYGEVFDYSSPALDEFEDPRIKEFKSLAVTPRDRYSNNRIPDPILGQIPMSTLVPWKMYENAWYSLISETDPVYSETKFLTEKTAKCLIGSRVFIMFNNAGTLAHIRSLGFKTFHGDLIDESYDSEILDSARWELAWQQVEKLAALDPKQVYQHFAETLDHNARLMKQYATNELENIQRFITNHPFLADPVPIHYSKDFYFRGDDGLNYNNPIFVPTTDYFIWDPHSFWQFNYGLNCDFEMFTNAEINRSEVPPNDNELRKFQHPRKNIAMLFLEKIYRPWTNPGITIPDQIKDLHLGWADLVIVYTTEQMKDWWPVVYGELCRQLHTDKIVLLTAGHGIYTDPDPNLVYAHLQSFISYVATGNDFNDINETNTPFRKYMFDALIGGAKTNRVALFYKLIDSEFQAQTLINLQPHPDSVVNWDQVDAMVPGALQRHKKITNYTSEDLLALEEDVVKDFKIDTKDKSAEERYSINTFYKPGYNLPGNQLMLSSVVPWKVYQSSWYSIVCETGDGGNSNLFITEKAAKCLFAKRIFVMFGSGNVLAYLRSLGFKTFHSDIIDESYDNEPDDIKRFNMAWQQVERLYRTDPRQVYAQYKDILEHNHQLMKSWTGQQIQEINEFFHRRLDYHCSRANNKKFK